MLEHSECKQNGQRMGAFSTRELQSVGAVRGCVIVDLEKRAAEITNMTVACSFFRRLIDYSLFHQGRGSYVIRTKSLR